MHSLIRPSVPQSLVDEFTNPDFWDATLEFLRSRFSATWADADGTKMETDDVDEEAERNAKNVWELWLESGKVWLLPTDVAKIRDQTGISSMGGI